MSDSHPSQPPDELTSVLWPLLLQYASLELRRFGGDRESAADMVQEAWLRWVEQGVVFINDKATVAWFRKVITRVVVDSVRKAKDPLDLPHLSLDEPWAVGQ